MSTSTDHPDMEVRRLEEAGHWLLQLREENLSEEAMQRWLEWCEADPKNLAAFERVQALWRGVPAQAAVPAKLQQALVSPRERQSTDARRARRFGSFAPWERVAAAAGAAAVVGLGSLALLEQRTPPDSITVAKLEAPPRVNQNSVLPDGSHVDLAAGSAVAIDYDRDMRRLKMQDGTAFFRVKQDKERPFVVQAGPLSVTAVGTAFNVRRNGQRVVVTVEEGVVRIDKESDKSSLQATAGYRLTYDADSREARLTPVNPAAELAWREGRLIYDGEPLKAVIENVNRYSPKKITLSDESLGQLRFTGTVFVDSIETWLGALPRAFPVRVKEGEGETTLLPK